MSNWSIETVDTSANLLLYSFIALDSSCYPHISYQDYNVEDLLYAYKDGSGWHIETVDSAGSVGEDTSMAIDASDYPHISYFDVTNGALKYAYKDVGGWHTENAVAGLWAGGTVSSIDLDSSGYPHISYRDNNVDQLKYAYKDGTGWHIETVDTGTAPGGGGTGYYSSLILDSSEYPHISYMDGAMGLIRYAYKDGAGWHRETAAVYAAATIITVRTVIDLDSSEWPHIAYTDLVTGSIWKLGYAYKDGSGWHSETVDDVEVRYNCEGFQLDSGDLPHISYLCYDGTSAYPKYAVGDGLGNWGKEVIEIAAGENNGHFGSLVLDAADRPHISYVGYTNNDLTYARMVAEPRTDFLLA